MGQSQFKLPRHPHLPALCSHQKEDYYAAPSLRQTTPFVAELQVCRLGEGPVANTTHRVHVLRSDMLQDLKLLARHPRDTLLGASRLEAIATRLEAIANRLEAIASRLEAIASRLEAIALRFKLFESQQS